METSPKSRSVLLPWLLLAIILFGGGVYVFRSRIADFLKPPVAITQPPAPVAAPAPTATGVTITSSSVLRKISQVNRLESLEMKISTVVTAKKDGSGWLLWQNAQKAMIIGEGTVTAGINLGDLKQSDIVVSPDGKSVKITLPPAEILATNLQRTQTYDTQSGLFGTINIDEKLLDQARADARLKLQTTACESDILQKATESSQHQMENLITMLGLDADITATPPAPCPVTAVE